jgi:DNA-binding transcriptional regulator YhcF (GntR family)
MPSSFHHIMSGLTTSVGRQNRRVRTASTEGFFQDSACSGVVPSVNTKLASLPFPLPVAGCRNRAANLINAVILALIQGDLKPGDALPDPPELARACHLPRHEVLTAVGYLLSGRILEQDRFGALRIHRGSAPTIEMKQQAFLARARELVGEARRWHLPVDCIDPLLYRAAHEET